MCGIAGEISWTGGADTRTLGQMSHGIRHRGPDDEGLWISEDKRCGLAFRRLSIIDLSPTGHQPMIDHLTGSAIVFNGEIYNYQSLRRDCEQLGEKFHSQSDTEVILTLYRREGYRCLEKLRGMFALTIWNSQKKELFLARDRLGKKPLNYALTQDGLVFCSEIDPLSRHPRVNRAHDPEALELYLQLLTIPSPWTIYKSVRKLPPAHFAVFSKAGLRLEQYWDVDYEPKERIGEAEALEAFEEKFLESVRLRMISDVPIGALLSGGVDSSAVVAAMAKLSSTPVKTFSVGFEEQDFNELAHAEEAARICGTDHTSQIVKGDAVELLPRIVRHYGEPFADSSAIPSFLVSETARESVTVVLNGDGGDELLAGYPHYRLSAITAQCGRLADNVLSPAGMASMTARLSGYDGVFPRAVSRGVREFLHPEFAVLMSYRSMWSDESRRALLSDGGARALLPDWRRRWLEASHAHGKHAIDRMLYFDNHTYLADDLLVKMDIASMHCSLEARSPLLDHMLIEFCAKLPVKFKLRDGSGKYLLKRLAARTFGDAFLARPKKGFSVPLEEWLKGPLRERMRDVLSDRRLMAPFDSRTIAKTVDEFLAGTSRQNRRNRIWVLFMYGLWREMADRVQAPEAQGDLPAGATVAAAGQ